MPTKVAIITSIGASTILGWFLIVIVTLRVVYNAMHGPSPYSRLRSRARV